MDRVTRNLIHSIPRTPTHQEVINEDGGHYTIETSWEDGYWDQPENSGSQQGGEKGAATSTEYVITTVKSGSLERPPLKDYRALSATPGRVTESYNLSDGIHRAELWAPSPDRDSKLELVRKGELYDLRAYKEERTPAKLFSETDEELKYRIIPVEVSPERLRELEYERKSIISNQKVKIWRSLDEEDCDTGSPPTSPKQTPSTSSIEFSLRFDSSKSLDTSFSHENVDTEQINFVAARQQFLTLEKQKPDLLQGLKPQSRQAKLSESKRYQNKSDWYDENESSHAALRTSQLNFDPERPCQSPGDTYTALLVPSWDEEMVSHAKPKIVMADLEGETKRKNFGQQVLISSSREDLRSGTGEVPSDFGEVYGSDGSSSREVSVDWQGRDSFTELTTHETPIEKEIRLALEREEGLRRERGIQGSANTKEMVAILKMPLLYQSPSSSPGRKGKENRRGSKFIQREIEKETKREDDLKSEGKAVGFYNKGPLEEIEERKKRFQQHDEVPVLPNKTIHYKSPVVMLLESKVSLVSMETSEKDKLQDGTQEDRRRNEEQVNRIPREAYEPYLTPYHNGTNALSDPSSYEHFSRYSWHPSSDFESQSPSLKSQDEPAKTVGQDDSLSSKDTFILQKEYFRWKPWTPTLSVTDIPQDPPDEPPTKHKLSEQTSYLDHAFAEKPLRSTASSVIEKEIQEAIQREEELQQQRRMLSQKHSDGDFMSTDLGSPLTQDPQICHQASGLPDRNVFSLFSTPFRPLVFRTTPDVPSSERVLLRENIDQTYGVAQASPPTPRSEWEPRTPGRLKDSKPDEFENRRSHQREEFTERRGRESPGAVAGPCAPPDRYDVSFSTPFRPLVFRTTQEESSEQLLLSKGTGQTYGAAPKGPAPPTSEWEPSTRGSFKDSQLQEFEGRWSRQRDEYGYAGIDPSDDVDHEVVESTRVSRRKSAMALRWEAGQYLNTQDD